MKYKKFNIAFSKSYISQFLVINILLFVLVFGSVLWAFKPPPPEPQTELTKLILNSPPETWGFPIRGSSGEIHYKKEYQKEVVIKVYLRGLLPNHEYILTLNGKPWHPSNKELPQAYGEERYYDFATITTDNIGNGETDITLTDLPSGNYNVKFFVKDPKNNWKIVLYNDFFIFNIK